MNLFTMPTPPSRPPPPASEQALYSILCSDEIWNFGQDEDLWIRFNEDGTGEIGAIGFLVFICAANFTWKKLPSTFIPHPREPGREPHILGTVNVGITLTLDMAASMANTSLHGFKNTMYFTDASCRPRTFAITIEQGQFIIERGQCILESARRERHHGYSFHRYALRLHFDHSPYPPEDTLQHHNNLVPWDPPRPNYWLARFARSTYAVGSGADVKVLRGMREPPGQCAVM